MKVVDIIFALICGWMANWVAFDFLKGFGIDFGYWRWLLSWVLPLAALAALWLAEMVGRKILFLRQASKFFLAGAFADIVDIKIFQALAWSFSFFLAASPVIFKGISFLAATGVKFWANRRWVFDLPAKAGKFEKESAGGQIFHFFAVTLIGLGINAASFYYFLNIKTQFDFPAHLWAELSIIFAALIAAVWNFTAYKFFVFKK